MMHVVLGDGEMSRRELSSTLEDLLEKAGDEDFWFLVQAKAEPTATDKALMEWIAERGIYFESIGDDPKSADPIYKDAQDKHTVKRLAPKVVSLMEEKPGEGEGAALFALFINNDEEVEDDKWLMDVATAVADAKFVVYAMNDGLAELGFDDEALEEEPEPAPPAKAVAKKAAAKPRPPADEDEEGESDGSSTATGDLDVALSREALEEKTLPELKEIAAARGIELPPRTRAQTYISVLLGEGDEEQVAEIEEVEVPERDDEDIAFEAEAMVVVIFNGTIMARTMGIDEARTIAAGV
jgi:hypothetical protein